MSMDVHVRGLEPGSSVWTQLDPNRWQLHRSGLRRRVGAAAHVDQDTGVAFTVDADGAAFLAHLNVIRADYYGREAAAALAALARAVGGDLVPEDAGGPRSADEVLEQWREANRFAHEVAPAAARASRAAADAFHAWQLGLTARRAECEQELIAWLPSLAWMVDADRRAHRVQVWAEGQAQALPESDWVVVVLHEGDQPGFVPYADVRDLLAPLLTTHVTSDGVGVTHVPLDDDDRSREVAAAHFAARDPLPSAEQLGLRAMDDLAFDDRG